MAESTHAVGVSIACCPSDQMAEALLLLFSHLDRQQQIQQINATHQVLTGDATSTAGLLVANRQDALVGVTLAATTPGRVGTLWPVRLIAGEPETTAAALYDSAHRVLRERDAVQSMVMIEDESGVDANRLVGAGYRRLAAILYLGSERSAFPTEPPTGRLKLQPFEQSESGLLAEIVEATYEGTLDCPDLDGARTIDDVLTGYRHTGEHSPELWLKADLEGEPAGCLLLTNHSLNKHVELMYMGILPRLRGQGLGIELVSHAQWLAQSAGHEQVVLAVDELNTPALAMYAEAGFQQWDRRVVYQLDLNTKAAESTARPSE